MAEIWKDIPGYEGRYQVSDAGNVRSLDRVEYRKDAYGNNGVELHYKGKLLSAKPKSCGHLNVSLGANNSKLVHRLVLLAFVGPPSNGEECLHHNGDPSDNRLENLRWGTRKENKLDEARHATAANRVRGSSRLNVETIANIRKDLAEGNYKSQKVIAKKYGVHLNTVNNINRKFTHKHVQT